MEHCYQDLIKLFNHCFAESHNTRLEKGGDEPIYLPADASRSYHVIYFAHGFFSSALHECAHWLIAGPARRLQVDFGYWYVPDGRNTEQQRLFQSVEVKPQAMEWILSVATGHRFRVSIDNLNGATSSNEEALFQAAVFEQVKQYCEQGLPSRAAIFYQQLSQFYETSSSLSLEPFKNLAGLILA